MRKILFLSFLLLLALGISGCSDKKEVENKSGEIKPVEVKIQTQPERLNPNEEIIIQAVVTQGNEKVNDASEVAFEISKQGQEEHEVIEAESKGNGIYEIKKTFPEAGIYTVIAHVTARDLHVMPKKDLTIGDPASTEHTENGSEHEHESTPNETEHEHGHEDGHGQSVGIELAQNKWKANQQSSLAAMIEYDNAPLAMANVRFEIWKENSHNHDFIDVKETGNGKYEAKTTFEQPGKYFVKIHVEKEDIHDHKEVEIVVEN